ncbi:hypothetical protein, partial [Ruminococcus sp.]|uniref:hypothetical protein n=1 Tax=Ruminococcus sp. TaxID=41978 RepID=UPI003AB697AB
MIDVETTLWKHLIDESFQNIHKLSTFSEVSILQNKNIPLYVRPFGDKRKPGTVIRGMSAPVVVPILILKKDQVLL